MNLDNPFPTKQQVSKESLLNQGIQAVSKGWLDEAEACARTLGKAFPDSGRAIYLQGLIFSARKEWSRAEQEISKAAAILPENADILSNLAVCRLAQGDVDHAVTALQSALRLNPDHVDSRIHLGIACHQQGRPEAAVKHLRQALEKAPGHKNALETLGDILETLARRALSISEYASAELFLAELAKIRPEDPSLLLLEGNLLLVQGRIDEAEARYTQAKRIKPDEPDIYANLGTAAAIRLDLDGALSAFNQAISLHPEHALSHFNRGLILLSRGDYEQGWRDYDYRTLPDGSPAQGSWLDYTPGTIEGKRIRVRYEQGFGDNLQFCRFLPLLKEAGAEVHFQCMPELRALMEASFDLDGFSDPASGEWDFDIPLLSLPRFFGIELKTVPNRVPYLHPPADRLKNFSDLCAGERFRVGFSWRALNTQHTDYRRRACTLDDLAPLFELPGIQWYSLEKGADDKQLHERDPSITNLAPRLHDFADTAAAVAFMDLVISTDTVVAHVPGALGKPVWTLVPFSADWRWLQNRNDSPWYPSMRLWRQPRPGDWQSLIAEMRECLKSM
ncbi:MAG: tetratricopeptide repeat protein [Planctomycetota bacterium]